MTQTQFARAYQDGQGRTVGFLLSKGLPEEEAKETAQAAWVRGWERRDQIREVRKTLTWINSIALNMYRSSLRRSTRHEPFDDLAVNPKMNLAAIDVRRLLPECGERERDLLIRRYFEERDIREIAEQCGCTETAVRVRLVRARKSLRRRFEGQSRGCKRG